MRARLQPVWPQTPEQLKNLIVAECHDSQDPATSTNPDPDEKQVGTAVVAEVQERFAIVTVTGQAAAADVI